MAEAEEGMEKGDDSTITIDEEDEILPLRVDLTVPREEEGEEEIICTEDAEVEEEDHIIEEGEAHTVVKTPAEVDMETATEARIVTLHLETTTA